MKKIVCFVMVMVFTLALGGAYASDGAKAGASDKELYNGITDFSGKARDRGDIEAPGTAGSIGGTGAGEPGPDKKLNNGITDFSGFKIEAPGKARSVEDAGAGDRASDNKTYNGITDFAGTENDRGEAPAMPVEGR